MSYNFTLTGNTSILSADFNPPLFLNKNDNYVLGLSNFESYNSIPNIDEGYNKFHYGDRKVITIPTGSYEISDLSKYISSKMDGEVLSLNANNNTLKTHIKCTQKIDFTQEDSIAKLLGFKSKILDADKS
jgi:hypothetical protein